MFPMDAYFRARSYVDKATKCCELKVYLKSGHRMTGLFHVSARTSSTIRPSDALMEKNNGLLLLSDVTVYETNVPRQVRAVMVPFDAISHIELPTGWSARAGSDAEDDQGGATPAPVHSIEHTAPSPTPRPTTSKWLVSGGQPPK
jgi:hypothetical protein